MRILRAATLAVFICVWGRFSVAQSLTELRYDVGIPSVVDYYVDPENGKDTNSGLSQSRALKTLTEAWGKIPQGQNLSTGFRINIMPGALSESAIPNYLESRYGTFAAPIIAVSSGRST